ncbi:MAG: hypothetical protein KAQ92_00270 [Candidatus Aenigmarchaeota archaeon]|nr:hypothetical protein [Candidatus Aenigmarchaeota archaeon]
MSSSPEPWRYAICLIVFTSFFVFYFAPLGSNYYALSAIFGYIVGSSILGTYYTFKHKIKLSERFAKNVTMKYVILSLILLSFLLINLITMFLKMQVDSEITMLALKEQFSYIINVGLIAVSAFGLMPNILLKSSDISLKHKSN